MRIKNIKNVKIETEFADVGAGLEPLTDEQYDLLENMVKKTRTPLKVHDFDDQGKWFICKLPESKGPEERVMKDGTSMMSIPLILPEGKWTNILVDEDADEVSACESHRGCNVAIVGNLVESKDGEFINVRGYRGMLLIADENIDENIDDDDPED